ncbi:hypothetical protein ACLK19_28355 [Escherichia coli]
MKKYVSLKQPRSWLIRAKAQSSTAAPPRFLLGREMCGKPVQIITNYLPLANYLIDQEHDSVIIMGGQYNKSQSITLSPQERKTVSMPGTRIFTSGKGLTAEGLYKTDMLSNGRAEDAERGRETGGTVNSSKIWRTRGNAF